MFNPLMLSPLSSSTTQSLHKDGDLQSSCFILSNLHVFIDKVLPLTSSEFVENSSFTRDYFITLYQLVAKSGYPPGTPNFLGPRVPLQHIGLNVESWRKRLVGYKHFEVVQFSEYGFPLGLQKDDIF